MSNKFGLILPDKSKAIPPKFQATRNVFGDESDSDEEGKRKPISLTPSTNINRQAKITQEKAVVEDPTVYQYDEIYDSMTSQKIQQASKSKEVKKPKYIENLLKTATKRKLENERRLERQIQRERDKEGSEFDDKEVFVTSAYKKKLEEMREEEEREKREEYLENIGDVTKQGDLGGFYRHLYEQRLGPGNRKELEEDKDSNKIKEDKNKSKEIDESRVHLNEQKENKLNRNYRKRKASDCNEPLSDGEIDETDEEINRLNLDDIKAAKKSKNDIYANIDADSDFSINESSDEEEKTEMDKSKSKLGKKKVLAEQKECDKNQAIQIDKSKDKLQVEKAPIDPKPKIDIWKKRTVGDVFDQALKRYYERKASRGY